MPPLRQSSHPWLVLGDFNSYLELSDKIGGNPLSPRDIAPLNLAVAEADLISVNKSGAKYSWNNRSRSGVRTFTTIDHAFINFQALSRWPTISVFLPQPIMSDHSPLILSLGHHSRKEKRSFKFFNAWHKHGHFLTLVSQVNTEFNCFGNPMYKFCRKLKRIKQEIKMWASSTFGTGSMLSTTLKEQLQKQQDYMMDHPHDEQATADEAILFNKVNNALSMEANMKRQQLHNKWIVEGDRNTKFFHDALKVKHARENIYRIFDEQGTLCTTDDSVDKAFVEYFTNLLGNTTSFSPDLDQISSLALPCITSHEDNTLIKPVTDEEIKDTLFSMNKHSSGGPDGLNVIFFTSTWDVLGHEFCQAIHNFFSK